MTSVEPRIAERRHRVTEERARHRMRWLVAAIVLIVLGAGGFWVIRSPLLSVRHIEVMGANRSAPMAIAESAGLVAGLPTMSVEEDAIAAALENDPWIEAATVEVLWPQTVRLVVTERVSVAYVGDGERVVALAADGTVLEQRQEAPESAALIEVTVLPVVGARVRSAEMIGAIDFVTALDNKTAAVTTVLIGDAVVTATVAGHEVRLGRPIHMADKAAVLLALLARPLDEAVVVDLTAPTHPAVAPREIPPNPESEVEAQEES